MKHEQIKLLGLCLEIVTRDLAEDLRLYNIWRESLTSFDDEAQFTGILEAAGRHVNTLRKRHLFAKAMEECSEALPHPLDARPLFFRVMQRNVDDLERAADVLAGACEIRTRAHLLSTIQNIQAQMQETHSWNLSALTEEGIEIEE